MNQEQEFQQYASLIEYYRNQLESLENQFSYLQAAIADYSKAKITIEKLGETENNTELLIPIGGGTFSFAKAVDPDKILTEIGAGIVVEKNPKDALETLTKRIEELKKSQDNISELSQKIQMQLQEVSDKAQEMFSGNR
jgi:prefoldin alpha subunit